MAPMIAVVVHVDAFGRGGDLPGDLIYRKRLDERPGGRMDGRGQTIRVGADQMRRQAGIGEIYLGSADSPRGEVPRPGRKPDDQENGVKPFEVRKYSGAVDAQPAGSGGCVGLASAERRRPPQQAGERYCLADAGESGQIALDHRIQVTLEPFPPSGRVVANRFGITSPAQPPQVFIPAEMLEQRRAGEPLEPPADVGRGTAGQLPFRQRAEAQDADPPGQGFTDSGNGQEVGGAGEQEPTGIRVGVHEPLDGSDHPVAAELYLVDRQRAASSGEEGQRIGQGRLPLRIVVERNVLTAPLLGYQPGKGCLSALTGPVQDDRAKSIERFAEAGPEVPADQFHKSNYSP